MHEGGPARLGCAPAPGARIEATNNKIKLLIRIAYGFRNIDAMIGLIMLFCSSIEIPWPSRKQKEPINKGSITTQAA